MVKKDGLLVLDFQDVMWGPQLYDLASLVWDNYCSVPETIQKEVLAGFWGEIGSPLLEIDPTAAVPEIPEGLPPAARQAFCFVALQRHLKALGTFGYQITQAGRIGYEKYVASTWQHARRAAEALEWESFLSVLSPLSHHLRGDLLD
jgi:hypothetical protein